MTTKPTKPTNGSIADVLDRVINLPTTTSSPSSATPSIGQKRARSPDEPRSVRFNSSLDTTLTIPPRLSTDQLLAQAEELSRSNPTKHLDPSHEGIRTAAAALEKTRCKNLLLRAEFGEDPEKFMMNEVLLNDDIVAFKDVAVDVSCYETLVECGVVRSLLSLLTHENSDVAMSVVSVLVELLDPVLIREGEEKEKDEEGMRMIATDGGDAVQRCAFNIGLLGGAFVDGGGLDSIASNLGRFDESVEEDAKGVEDTLTLVENLLDLDGMNVLRSTQIDQDDRPESIVASLFNTTFISWLFHRIEKTCPTNEAAADSPVSPAVLRLHSSELLSTILQHEDYSMQRCGRPLASLPRYISAFDDADTPQEMLTNGKHNNSDDKSTNVDGMEILLQSIAAYRKSDPKTEVECEFLENTFDALAASLLRPDNVADFVTKEGIELMLRCIREKVHSGGAALKVLNFALSGSPQGLLTKIPDTDIDTTHSHLRDIAQKACEVFLQAGGLKLLFPLYMARKSAIPCPAECSEGGSSLAKKAMMGSAGGRRARRAAHARKKWLGEVEQNSIGVMYALTRYIDVNSLYDSHARLLVKFVEDDCEKCDRTIELCLKYDEKARIAEYQYFRSDEAEEAELQGLDLDLRAIHAKLRGGGDVFHRLCAVIAFACVNSTRCHGHVREQLKVLNSSISVIKEGLAEFASLLVEGAQKAQIEHYSSSI